MTAVADRRAAAPDATSGRDRHHRSLDGIRALAVLAVLFFHGQMPWATGGFLGVSVFFTLSGYLITSLVLEEHGSTGRIDPGRFWGRRFRRLSPASLGLLGTLLVLGVIGGISHRVVIDIRAAALDVANWWSIHTGTSYADIFTNPSPTEHFWSLAIEEQFYLLFPVIAWLCLRGPRRRARRRFLVVLAVLATAGVSAGLAIPNPDRVYLGTDTRMPELLIGALLAFAWPLWTRRTRRMGALGTGAGIAALALIAFACWQTNFGDSWVTQGGLPAFALISATLIAVAARRGPLASALGCAPLRRLGEISYGVYLFHWPIFLWLDQRRTGWGLGWLLIVRIVLTVALAALTYRLFEEPIRRRRWLGPTQAKLAFSIGLAAVVAATFIVPTTIDDREALAAVLSGKDAPGLGVVATSTSTPRPNVTTTTAPAPPPMIALAGDSVPTVLISQIGDLAGSLDARLLNLGIEACDGARGAPDIRYGPGRPAVENPLCQQWDQTWPPLLDQYRPTALVFMLGAAAVLDRKLGGRWTHACRPDFNKWYHDELIARIDWVHAHSDAKVMLTISPWAEFGTIGLPADHQARTDCLNRTYEQVLTERPDVVRIDARDWLCPSGKRGCQPLRTDGLHYRGDGAQTFARWLLPEVLSHVGTQP